MLACLPSCSEIAQDEWLPIVAQLKLLPCTACVEQVGQDPCSSSCSLTQHAASAMNQRKSGFPHLWLRCFITTAWSLQGKGQWESSACRLGLPVQATLRPGH